MPLNSNKSLWPALRGLKWSTWNVWFICNLLHALWRSEQSSTWIGLGKCPWDSDAGALGSFLVLGAEIGWWPWTRPSSAGPDIHQPKVTLCQECTVISVQRSVPLSVSRIMVTLTQGYPSSSFLTSLCWEARDIFDRPLWLYSGLCIKRRGAPAFIKVCSSFMQPH